MFRVQIKFTILFHNLSASYLLSPPDPTGPGTAVAPLMP